MSSFDPDNFGSTSSGRGRGSSSYDDHDSGRSSGRSGESGFRTVPLVLTILFALVALVCTVISFGLGTDLTAEQESQKSILLLAGMASFIALIVVGRKIKR